MKKPRREWDFKTSWGGDEPREKLQSQNEDFIADSAVWSHAVGGGVYRLFDDEADGADVGEYVSEQFEIAECDRAGEFQ